MGSGIAAADARGSVAVERQDEGGAVGAGPPLLDHAFEGLLEEPVRQVSGSRQVSDLEIPSVAQVEQDHLAGRAVPGEAGVLPFQERGQLRRRDDLDDGAAAVRRPLPPAARENAGFEAGESEEQISECGPRVARVLTVENESGVGGNRVAGSWSEGYEALTQRRRLRPAIFRRKQKTGIEGQTAGDMSGAERGWRLPAVPAVGVAHVEQLGPRLPEGVGHPVGVHGHRFPGRQVKLSGRLTGGAGLERMSGGTPGRERAVEDADLGAAGPAQQPEQLGDRLAVPIAVEDHRLLARDSPLGQPGPHPFLFRGLNRRAPGRNGSGQVSLFVSGDGPRVERHGARRQQIGKLLDSHENVGKHQLSGRTGRRNGPLQGRVLAGRNGPRPREKQRQRPSSSFPSHAEMLTLGESTPQGGRP